MGENDFIENNNIFTLDGFDVTSNLSPPSDVSRAYQYGDIITLGALSAEGVSEASLLKPNTQNIEALDLSNPRLYLKYSSFVELIRGSLENIIVSYPSSLRISPVIVGYSYGDVNVIDISYDSIEDTTSFFVLSNYLDNPGNIVYVSGVNNINPYKDITSSYFNYLFEYQDQYYEISHLLPSSKVKNDKIGLTVRGRPFASASQKQISGHITPSKAYLTEYLSQLSYFERYLLRASFEIVDTAEESGGIEYEYKTSFTLPKSDKYNYDFESERYEKFLSGLLQIASKYDDKYLNVTSRSLIPQSFQDISITSGNFPTYGKANQLLNVMSSYFDCMYGNINALRYYDQVNLRNDSFDDKNRVVRLSETLGLKIINNGGDQEGWLGGLKPFVKNVPFLLNSKGARKSISTTLNYLNIPDSLIEFNEKIYKAKKLNYEALSHYYDVIGGLSLSGVPIKQSGAPDLSKNVNVFHSKGYFSSLKNLLPDIEDNFISMVVDRQYSEILADISFNLSGDTLAFSLHNLDWSALACYSYTGGTINSPLPEIFYDNCDCAIPLNDLSLQACMSPVNPYDSYCPPLIVDVVPNCVAILLSGTTLSGDTACHFNLSFYSQGGVQDKVEPVVPSPTNYISFPYVIESTSCNTADNEELLLEHQVICAHYYNNSFALMSAGGYVSMIRLYDTISGLPLDLNLTPSTTPYLSGCAGTVLETGLIFPTGTTQTELGIWADNLKIVIENAICVEYGGLPLPPLNNVTYFMSVDAFADGSFNIAFNNKNGPVSPEYNIGINKNNPSFSFFDGASFYNSNSYFLSFENLGISYTGDTVCGSLFINKEVSEAGLAAVVEANYGEISFNVSSPVIDTIDNGSVLSSVCLVGGSLTGDTFSYGAYLDINVYGGIPPYSFTGITQGEFLMSGETYSFYVGDSACNILHVTGDVICNEDLCLGNQVSAKTTQVVEIVEIETEVSCPAIEITHTMSLAGNGNEVGEMTTYGYDLVFNNFEELSSPYYEIDIEAESNLFSFTGNTESFSESVSFVISSLSVSLTAYIRLYDGGCIYEQEVEIFTLEYGLVEEDTSNDTLLAPSYIEITEQEVMVDKIVYEVTPNTPVLSAAYACNEDGVAVLSVGVSGGTAPYVFYGGSDGQIVADGTIISIYAEDANGCVSNAVELDINCEPSPIDCNAVNLDASLETTSIDSINETATLTFTYNITGLAFDESVEEVNLVASGVGATNSYILGSPVMKSFSGAFGATQIYLDFTPSVLMAGTYKFIIVIKTENCTYTDIFEMSVDASILSDVDNYTNILE